MTTPYNILRENAETYKQKNADYGKSWQAIGSILHGLSHGEPITLETEQDFISFGLFTRRLDKLARAFNAEFMTDELNFESTADAHEDESTYAAMAASLIRENEPVEYFNRGDVYPGGEDNPSLEQHHNAPKDENDDPIFDEPEVPVSIGYRGEARALHEAGLDDVQIQNILSGETELTYELEYNKRRAEGD